MAKDTKKKQMTVIWCCRNKNGSSMPLIPFHHLFLITSSVCKEELTRVSCWLFGLLEHRTCSRVSLFLKMILFGVYPQLAQVQVKMQGAN